MIRETMALKLKEFRKTKGLSTAEAGKLIGKSAKTISAWERGRGQPDADALIKLCEIYEIGSVAELFGEVPTSILNYNEANLINDFRELNDEGQDKVIVYAKDLLSSGKYKKTLSISTGTEGKVKSR